MGRTTNLALAAAAAALLWAAAPAGAETYPAHPVHLLIGNSPGGPSDTSLRAIGDILGRAMGQPFVVENRPGGNGMIAGRACAAAAPDGYTFCMADSFNIALNPALYPNMPYDPLTDLKPVIHTGFLPSGLWVRKGLPASSMRELFDVAKAQPGTVNFATFGPASSSGIYVEWLRKVKGLDYTDIPYKSAQDAFTAVVSGQSDIAVYGLRAGLGQLAGGTVKLLSVNTDARMADLPDVPTFREAGIENVMITWFALFAPKGTPDEITRRINAEVAKGLFGDPEMRAKFLDAQGLLVYGPAGKSPEDLATFIRSEVAVYADIVQKAKIKVQE